MRIFQTFLLLTLLLKKSSKICPNCNTRRPDQHSDSPTCAPWSRNSGKFTERNDMASNYYYPLFRDLTHIGRSLCSKHVSTLKLSIGPYNSFSNGNMIILEQDFHDTADAVVSLPRNPTDCRFIHFLPNLSNPVLKSFSARVNKITDFCTYLISNHHSFLNCIFDPNMIDRLNSLISLIVQPVNLPAYTTTNPNFSHLNMGFPDISLIINSTPTRPPLPTSVSTFHQIPRSRVAPRGYNTDGWLSTSFFNLFADGKGDAQAVEEK